MDGTGRKSKKSDRPDLFQTWVRKITDGHRLRLSREDAQVIPWLAAQTGPIDCVGTVGPDGGICLGPARLIDPIRKSLVANLRGRNVTLGETGSPWVRLARYLATSWVVRVTAESGRFSLTLPEEARKLRLAPETGQIAVVFAIGEIVEVWPADEWVRHVRHSAASIDELKEAALDALTNE